MCEYSDNRIPMKIGTIPCLVWVHGSDKNKMSPGNWVRIKEMEGDRWHKVLITDVIDGNIFASR